MCRGISMCLVRASSTLKASATSSHGSAPPRRSACSSSSALGPTYFSSLSSFSYILFYIIYYIDICKMGTILCTLRDTVGDLPPRLLAPSHILTRRRFLTIYINIICLHILIRIYEWCVSLSRFAQSGTLVACHGGSMPTPPLSPFAPSLSLTLIS